jgi:hypothetical protein
MSAPQEFENFNQTGVAVVEGGVLELVRANGALSERWLIRMLEVTEGTGTQGQPRVGWQRVGMNEEGTLTFAPDGAGRAGQLVDALVAAGARRKG